MMPLDGGRSSGLGRYPADRVEQWLNADVFAARTGQDGFNGRFNVCSRNN